jgi:hypothetical protein
MPAATIATPILEMAFTGTDTTPTWTNVTAYLQSFGTRRGRSHELDQFSAGTLSLTLKNNDRRFDPEYAAGPYFGNLTPNIPVRLRATWNAVTYPIFRGYVDGWPQSYEIPDASFCDVTATDGFKAFARLNVVAGYTDTILASTPSHWWAFDDTPIQAVYPAADKAGENNGTYFADVHAANSSLTGGGAGGVLFAGFGQYVKVPPAAMPATQTWSMQGWFQSPVAVSVLQTLFCMTSFDDAYRAIVWIDVNGLLNAQTTNAGTPATTITTAGPVVGTDQHHYAMVSTASNFKLYLDGVLVGTTTVTTPTLRTYGSGFFIGARSLLGIPTSGFEGTLQHAVLHYSELSAGTVLNHYNAGDGYVGEAAGTRAGRVLDTAAWPAGLRAIDAGTITAQGITKSDRALNMLQTLDQTEYGQMYMDASGLLTFRDRWALLTDSRSITSQATFGDTAGEIAYQDLRFDFDDAKLRNYVTAQRNGGVPQVAQDATSITDYYTQDYSRTGTLEQNDNQVNDIAHAIVTNHKDPRTRISSFKVMAKSSNGNTVYPQMLGREIGDRITVTRRPQGVGSAITYACYIEGISHQATPESWTTEFQLSAVIPMATTVLLVGSGTQGIVGTNVLGY